MTDGIMRVCDRSDFERVDSGHIYDNYVEIGRENSLMCMDNGGNKIEVRN
jgi:hypothetical protein